MNLKQLINKSYYGVIGYVASKDDLARIEQYILYSLDVLKEFDNIIVATTYGIPLDEEHKEVWKKYFPDCIILDLPINRGHNFGTADLDNAVFDYCKENNIEWLCKGANDILFKKELLGTQVEKADFYYLNGFSFETIYLNEFNPDKLEDNHFTPQTNFYIINVSKTDYLNDKKYLDETYEYFITVPNFNNKPWEYIKGWSCEEFLAKCIERNNLTKSHLLSKETYLKLFNTIRTYKIGDPSHKNLFINGICHLQFPQQPVIEI